MNELEQEKYNIVVRQCCMLIDEKRALQGQLAIAYANMRDIIRMCDFPRQVPLNKIKAACQQFLDLPELP